MKKTFFVAIITSLISISAYSQTRYFGLGLQLGEPTGLNAKIWTGRTNAVDLALAWSFKGEDRMVMQADYVWHSFDIFPVSKGELPLYFGIGGRAVLRDDPVLGLRIPVGLDYMFESAPLDIFVEIAPTLNLVPSTDFDLGGAFGIRFWFN